MALHSNSIACSSIKLVIRSQQNWLLVKESIHTVWKDVLGKMDIFGITCGSQTVKLYLFDVVWLTQHVVRSDTIKPHEWFVTKIGTTSVLEMSCSIGVYNLNFAISTSERPHFLFSRFMYKLKPYHTKQNFNCSPPTMKWFWSWASEAGRPGPPQ